MATLEFKKNIWSSNDIITAFFCRELKFWRNSACRAWLATLQKECSSNSHITVADCDHVDAKSKTTKHTSTTRSRSIMSEGLVCGQSRVLSRKNSSLNFWVRAEMTSELDGRTLPIKARMCS